MSRTIPSPTILYEIVPDRFDPESDIAPLRAIRERLDHLERLGVEGISLTPVFPSSDELRLHAIDYRQVDPALGTLEDFTQLCQAAEERGMSVILMGAFDHVSKDHPWFVTAKTHTSGEEQFTPERRTRSFFSFDKQEEHGYAARGGDPDAPELNLKNPEVRRRLFTSEHSVLFHWLYAGARGWRILRAEQVGYSILRECRRGILNVEGAHTLIGDIKGFADRYVRDGLLDGVVNHYQREGIIAYLRNKVPARQLSRVLRDLRKSYGPAWQRGWNLLSGHDTRRARALLGDERKNRLAVLLSYTLPGAAHILYGDEVGLYRPRRGARFVDMTWDRTRWDAALFDWYTDLGVLRKTLPALRHGDFVDLTPEGEDEIVAFARMTADPRETVLVVVNRAAQTRVRQLFAPVCDLPDGLKLRDALSGPGASVRAGSITLEVLGQDARILVPDENDAAGARFFRGY